MGSTVEVSDQPRVLNAPATLLKDERVSLKMETGSLLLSLKIGKSKGHFVHGSGMFLLDSIVETEMGAVGRPVKRKLEEPFIILGPLQEEASLDDAAVGNLESAGYGDADAMVKLARDMATRFSDRIHRSSSAGTEGNFVAFPRNDGFDFLVVKGNKIVYREEDMTFVSRDGKDVILNGCCDIAVSKPGKSVSIKGGNIVIAKKGKRMAIKDGNIIIERGSEG